MENTNVESLIGGDVKFLDDMVGSVAVNAWRGQAERAAVRLCGKTGKMMLHGTFPSTRPGTSRQADKPPTENDQPRRRPVHKSLWNLLGNEQVQKFLLY